MGGENHQSLYWAAKEMPETSSESSAISMDATAMRREALPDRSASRSCPSTDCAHGSVPNDAGLDDSANLRESSTSHSTHSLRSCTGASFVVSVVFAALIAAGCVVAIVAQDWRAASLGGVCLALSAIVVAFVAWCGVD